MKGRIPVTERAFQDWVQSVEDRLKGLRRDARGQRSAFDTLAAAEATIGTVHASDLDTGSIHVSELLSLPITTASTLGTVIGSVALVDDGGQVVGYLPVYDAIT